MCYIYFHWSCEHNNNIVCAIEHVVVGFKRTVYMVEESQGLIRLPVAVKEGQLTQKVVLQVTTEDRTTSGILYMMSI